MRKENEVAGEEADYLGNQPLHPLLVLRESPASQDSEVHLDLQEITESRVRCTPLMGRQESLGNKDREDRQEKKGEEEGTAKMVNAFFVSKCSRREFPFASFCYGSKVLKATKTKNIAEPLKYLQSFENYLGSLSLPYSLIRRRCVNSRRLTKHTVLVFKRLPSLVYHSSFYQNSEGITHW